MKRIPLIALLVAVVLPATGAAAKTAYFKVRISAGQDITWKQDQVLHSQDCGVVHMTGSGESLVGLSSDWRAIKATQTPWGVTFAYSQSHPEIPITGHVERNGQAQNNYVGQPPPPNPMCGKPETGLQPDCGIRPYPVGTTVGIVWDTPKSWPKNAAGPRPKAPSLHLNGPIMPTGARLPFSNCLGESLDYQLGINAYPAPNTNDGFAPLPLSTIFGKRKRFTAHARLDIHTQHQNLPEVTGSWDTHTQVEWTVKFLRLTRPGKSPAPITPSPLG